MNVTLTPSALSKRKLAATLFVGLIAGGASVFAVQSVSMSLDRPLEPEIELEAIEYIDTTPRVEAAPEAVVMTASVTAAPNHQGLSEREREVLRRLASLPDLPVVQAPAFDIKTQSAGSNAPAKVAGTSAKPAAAAKPQPTGESVIARIQVLSVEKGRVFYRSVDDNIHTARAGERLLGVNGRVLKVDEHGAELQIDGHHMRVAASNM